MPKPETFLVIGVDGMIGKALISKWIKRSVLATTHLLDTLDDFRIHLDLSDDTVAWQPPDGIAVAVICSAITSLDRCRAQPEETAQFNVYNTVKIAKSALCNGVFVIFPSTNLVYDGSVAFRRADDPVCPVTQYGCQKAEVEKQLLAFKNMTSVVRFTKVIGLGSDFFAGWIRSLKRGQAICPFSDMVMSPVSLPYAVDVIDHVANLRFPGIVQVSGSEDITYEEAARYITRRLGMCQDLVRPIRSSDLGLSLESVPTHTTLDTSRLITDLGMQPPSVWSTLDSILDL
jgi:dTDP-4-dehydrorhamnose reductase